MAGYLLYHIMLVIYEPQYHSSHSPLSHLLQQIQELPLHPPPPPPVITSCSVTAYTYSMHTYTHTSSESSSSSRAFSNAVVGKL